MRHKLVLYNTHISAIDDAIGIGDDGVQAKEKEADQALAIRVNDNKIAQKRAQLKKELAAKSEQEINGLIEQFKKDLPKPTQEEKDALNKEDIKDQIIQQKINKRRAEILKEDPNKTKENIDKELENFKKELKITDAEIEKQQAELKQQLESLKLGVITKAIGTNSSLEIELLDVTELLPADEDKKLYNSEVNQFAINGFAKSFKVKEVPPINWLNVIGVAIIGFVQLVAGAALTVFTLGAGSSIGMGLISEGVSDLIAAVVDGIINRDFSWESWGI